MNFAITLLVAVLLVGFSGCATVEPILPDATPATSPPFRWLETGEGKRRAFLLRESDSRSELAGIYVQSYAGAFAVWTYIFPDHTYVIRKDQHENPYVVLRQGTWSFDGGIVSFQDSYHVTERKIAGGDLISDCSVFRFAAAVRKGEGEEYAMIPDTFWGEKSGTAMIALDQYWIRQTPLFDLLRIKEEFRRAIDYQEANNT